MNRKAPSLGQRVLHKLLHSDSVVFTFLRSIVSSQAASWVDLGLGFLLFHCLGFEPWLATAMGAICGGVVNCAINYRFTFHAQDCPVAAVVVKYAMVWCGSLALNALGTQGLYWLLGQWHWLESIGFRPDGYYAAARLTVSLLVSWFWNFVLQRCFVYRPHPRFDGAVVSAIQNIKNLIFHHDRTDNHGYKENS